LTNTERGAQFNLTKKLYLHRYETTTAPTGTPFWSLSPSILERAALHFGACRAPKWRAPLGPLAFAIYLGVRGKGGSSASATPQGTPRDPECKPLTGPPGSTGVSNKNSRAGTHPRCMGKIRNVAESLPELAPAWRQHGSRSILEPYPRLHFGARRTQKWTMPCYKTEGNR
jgi:hypothetical protein